MKTTLILKDEVVKRAKRRAAELGLTLSAFAERSLRDALEAKPVTSKPFHFPTYGDGRRKVDRSPTFLKSLLED
jgi:hypothetical protein